MHAENWAGVKSGRDELDLDGRTGAHCDDPWTLGLEWAGFLRSEHLYGLARAFEEDSPGSQGPPFPALSQKEGCL